MLYICIETAGKSRPVLSRWESAVRIIGDENIPCLKEAFSRLGKVESVPGRKLSAETIRNADVLLVRSVTRVNESLLENTSIKFVGTATIGMNHVDLDYLAERKIGFASAPGSNANSVAEYIMAAILVIAERHDLNLEGSALGIVGAGNVGSRVLKMADVLGMKTMLNDPPLRRQTGDDKYRPLDKILGADFITLHVPLTFEGEDKTHHLANGNFFGRMKRNAFFINSSRGGVMDSAALFSALENKRIKGASLDVWENEPNMEVEFLRRVELGTPHIAGYSLDGKVNGTVMIYEACCKHFKLNQKWNWRECMPEAKAAEIEVDCNDQEQKVILRTIRKVYDIEEDDRRFRQILSRRERERRGFFDALRANYHVRREFHNTKLLFNNCSEALKKKLAGLGFIINDMNFLQRNGEESERYI